MDENEQNKKVNEMKDYYKILEIRKEASQSDIKVAYRKLARQYHPDSNHSNEMFNDIMQEINEAYQTLSKSETKTAYDKKYDTFFGYKQQKKTHSSKQKQQEAPKNPRPNVYYIWDGHEVEALNRSFNFEAYRDVIVKKANITKGEFETTVQFEEKIKQATQRAIHHYLGKQNVSMLYNADTQTFLLSLNDSLTFEIEVPLSIAPIFKTQVKSLSVYFSKTLKITQIESTFQGRRYVAKNYNVNWFVDEEEEKKKRRLKYKNIKEEEEFNKATNKIVLLFAMGVLTLMGIIGGITNLR